MMHCVEQTKSKRICQRFKKRKPKNHRLFHRIDRGVKKVGDLLSFFNLDGIHHIVDPKRHIFERILWFVIMLAFGFGVFYLCYSQWARYKANPTVISLERDYRNWNGTMPAVTLCYSVKHNQSLVEEYVFRTWRVRKNDADFEYLSSFVESIANITLDRLYQFIDFEGDDRLRDVNLRQLVEFVYPNYDHTIKLFDETIPFDSRLILTERGMCHVINAPISKLLTVDSFRSSDKLNPTLSCFMYKNECFMKVDFYTEASIEFHSPEEVPVHDSVVMQFKPTNIFSITYKVTETLASDSLRALSIQQRKCVFRNEIFSKNPKFTGKLCEMNCRARNAVELCNCKPFFYPFIDAPECKINGYLCLHYKAWPMWTLRRCDCPASCIHYSYIERNRAIEIWSDAPKANPYDDVLFRPKASIRWEIVSTKVRNRRDVIFSFADFVGSFGGAAALFLGVNFWHFAVVCLKILEKLVQLFRRREQNS